MLTCRMIMLAPALRYYILAVAKSAQGGEKSGFLNVDLDLYSKTNLQPLVAALGPEVFSLYLGRERRLWCAHLELAEQPPSADAAIRRFAHLILALPPEPRSLWDRATIRDFNIGLQAGSKPRMWEFKLAPRTIRIVSSLKVRIVITVYAPTMIPPLGG